ncbi:hypothetical protein [Streptomonospora salina]|uniref:Uncharacterized protein n=1 Tax=Streptomonospora salina TaxID=104205 RepID=A0A841EEU6_9ACTN|nr:hypothetical protein [Streptomonospora salina]MBB6000864.1 hypothetical protein [Streptomonospora salina]
MPTLASKGLPELHPDAAALTAIRTIGDDQVRAYTIAEPTQGWRQINQLLRQAAACGLVRPATERMRDAYAVLDVLNGDDDIVQDYAIPTAAAWRWWYRKLHLRIAA